MGPTLHRVVARVRLEWRMEWHQVGWSQYSGRGSSVVVWPEALVLVGNMLVWWPQGKRLVASFCGSTWPRRKFGLARRDVHGFKPSPLEAGPKMSLSLCVHLMSNG